MITKDILFVLGAGASYPYGFPLGGTLLDQICDFCSNANNPRAKVLIDAGHKLPVMQQFARSLRYSGIPSIDSFLELRPEYHELGKAAIAAALIQCENPASFENVKSEEHWYRLLWGKMFVPKEELSKNRCSFVTFNYDRSLEFYLHRAMVNSYGVSPDAGLDLLRSIPIVHVHGTLGSFFAGDEDHRVYAPDLNVEQVTNCSRSIRVFHEDAGDDAVAQRMEELFESCRFVCFLGFGYHQANLERLGFMGSLGNKTVFGSACGMMNAEQEDVLGRFDRRITLGQGHHGCNHFLRHTFSP